MSQCQTAGALLSRTVRVPSGRVTALFHVTTVMVMLQLIVAPAVAAQASVATWRVTPVWSVDGSESGEPFGNLRDYAIGKDGVVWALDFKDQIIRRFDQTGKALTVVGRKGAGPGEMRNANGLVVRRDGSVWVVDQANARLSVFRADGKFLKQHSLPISGFGYRWEAWIDRQNGDLMDNFTNMKDRQRTTKSWRRVSDGGMVGDTLEIPTCASGAAPGFSGYRAQGKTQGGTMGSYPFTFGGGSAPDGVGGMWCATPQSTHAVLVRIGKNDTTARSAVDIPAIPVAKAERDNAISTVQKRLAAYETSDFDPDKVPNTKPGIASLTVDDDGRLWLQHTARVGVKSVTYDVHDRTGKHLGRVTIPFRGSGDNLPIRARGNDIWLAVLDDDDVVSLAKFRITK